MFLSLARHITVSALAVAACGACAAPSPTERAQSLVRRHKEEEAVALLQSRVGAYPEDVPARRLLVRLLALTGDMPGARLQAEALARRLPGDDPTAYIELGHALELSHRYDDALAAYDEAASRAPRSAAGPREGGMRSARWGETEAARPRLEEAIRRGARDAETWHTLGLVRLHGGDLDGAEEAYRAGVASDPAMVGDWIGLATVALVRGDAQGALEAYDRVLARQPHFAPAELGRAWALAKLGRPLDASRALDRAEEMGAPESNVSKQREALLREKGARQAPGGLTPRAGTAR